MTTNQPAPKQSSSTLRNVLLIVGSIVIAIVLLFTIVRVVHANDRQDTSGSFEVNDSFTALDIRGRAADVNVEYSNVDRPIIRFEQGDTNLRMTHRIQHDELRIEVRNDSWGWFGFPDWGHWGGDFLGSSGATLEVTLPADDRDLLSLAIESTAGNLDIDGEFAAVTIESTAGDVAISGGADSLDITTTAGDVRARDFALEGRLHADSTAGDVEYEFRGLPESMDVSSTAGNVSVLLEDGDYRIDTETTAGEVRQDVSSDAHSDRLYRFETTAGDILISER